MFRGAILKALSRASTFVETAKAPEMGKHPFTWEIAKYYIPFMLRDRYRWEINEFERNAIHAAQKLKPADKDKIANILADIFADTNINGTTRESFFYQFPSLFGKKLLPQDAYIHLFTGTWVRHCIIISAALGVPDLESIMLNIIISGITSIVTYPIVFANVPGSDGQRLVNQIQKIKDITDGVLSSEDYKHIIRNKLGTDKPTAANGTNANEVYESLHRDEVDEDHVYPSNTYSDGRMKSRNHAYK